VERVADLVGQPGGLHEQGDLQRQVEVDTAVQERLHQLAGRQRLARQTPPVDRVGDPDVPDLSVSGRLGLGLRFPLLRHVRTLGTPSVTDGTRPSVLKRTLVERQRRVPPASITNPEGGSRWRSNSPTFKTSSTRSSTRAPGHRASSPPWTRSPMESSGAGP